MPVRQRLPTWLARVAPGVGFALLSVVMTWPLARDVTHRLPSDLGDPLLVCWILAWQIRNLTRLATGDWTVLHDWSHANIFHPAGHAIAYSELFAFPALAGAPVLLATGNVILTYNVLFLGTFLVAGLAMYALTRELTGSRAGAWIGGLLFAFAPFRFDHAPHLQAQFGCLMPLVLWQMDRGVATGRVRHAVWAGLALAAVNLSNGYLMFYFSPFVAAFGLFALWRHQRLGDLRRWLHLGLAAGLALAVTVPFMLPYLALRAAGQEGRSLDWLIRYSASASSWLTATPWLRLWNWLALDPRPETHLFPGLVPIALTGLACSLVWRSRREVVEASRVGMAAVHWFCVGAIAVSLWWAFGPIVHVAGEATRLPSVYAWILAVVPGFDALRVPARIAGVMTLWTSLAAGIAMALLLRRVPRTAVWLATMSVLVLADAWVAPMRMHEVLQVPHYRGLSPAIEPRPVNSPLAQAIRRLPREAVLVELPFGALPHEARYMYTSIGHWRRMVNGYSGEVPASYYGFSRALQFLPERGPEAWQAMHDAGATHVVLHGEHYGEPGTTMLASWLTGRGARRVDQVGETLIFQLP
jgi:hypothetical protein